ncbi:MAG: hypothetical protein LBN09_04775 [Clostridioides sp.]|jgi:hypothetical protein|nr:hypothetical protein [Clostridioides sp.]
MEELQKCELKNIDEYKSNQKNNNKKRRRCKHRKDKSKVVRWVARIAGVTLVLGAIMLNLSGYATISRMKYDIYSLKNDLRKKEITLDGLRAESIKDGTITEVENRARLELHMDYPKESQIKYIDLGR